MPSFADIHGKKPEDIKAPPAFPFGHYIATVDGQPQHGQSSRARTKQIQFKAKLLQPLEDVDKDKLMAWKDDTGDSVMGQHVYLTFYDPQPWRLAEFLKNLGLGNVPFPECLAETPGRQFVVEIGHAPSMDGTRIIHEVRGTSALPSN